MPIEFFSLSPSIIYTDKDAMTKMNVLFSKFQKHEVQKLMPSNPKVLIFIGYKYGKVHELQMKDVKMCKKVAVQIYDHSSEEIQKALGKDDDDYLMKYTIFVKNVKIEELGDNQDHFIITMQGLDDFLAFVNMRVKQQIQFEYND